MTFKELRIGDLFQLPEDPHTVYEKIEEVTDIDGEPPDFMTWNAISVGQYCYFGDNIVVIGIDRDSFF